MNAFQVTKVPDPVDERIVGHTDLAKVTVQGEIKPEGGVNVELELQGSTSNLEGAVGNYII